MEPFNISRRRMLQIFGFGALIGGASPAMAEEKARVFIRPADGSLKVRRGPTGRSRTRTGKRSRVDPKKPVRDHGGNILLTFDNFDFIVASVPQDSLSALAKDDRIEKVERDTEVKALACSDHPGEQLWWGVDRIGADSVSVTGNSVNIGVLDTGLDKDHCDLEGNIAGGHNCTGRSTSSASAWDDGNGHGSHCGGIAAAGDNAIGVRGVAPDANLYGVKVLGDNGTGYWSWIVCGIDWCMTNDIEILSMSFGASSMPSDAHNAISEAYDRGHLIVAAAGNSGGGSTTDCEDNVIQPARHSDVIAVSAIDKNDELTGYSSTGTEVELAAPGGGDSDGDGIFETTELIYSTYKNNDYTSLQGTSMACPHVTGAAALITDAYGGITLENSEDGSPEDNETIREALQNAEDIGLLECQQGYGLVDAEAAVNSANATPTVTWTNPGDSSTVSGDVSIGVDAGDADGSVSTVEWRYEGGSWRGITDGDGDGTYEDTWDTTGVSDGSYTLTARVTDDDGAETTASITVTVDNVNESPTVTWTNPSDGDSVEGSVAVSIDASDDRDSESDLAVEWRVDGGSWRSASYTATTGYHEDMWDSTAVSDGNHTLGARATDLDGNTGSEVQISVSVGNTSPSDMYVSNPTFDEFTRWRTYLTTTVTIRHDNDRDGVAESSDDLVGGAAVDMTLWVDENGDGSYEDSWQVSGETNSDGEVQFWLRGPPDGDYKAEITNVAHDTHDWNSSLDVENPDYYCGFPGGSEC